ncbi:MAG: hypothetical protein CFE28_01380 [Alphaproteobacteria bacterium PA2]|nr:MAG: hypothetical protein CFE28_01380 [Alphaproteobacteria bacterium PA2]
MTPRGGRDAIDGWDRDAAGRIYLKARVTSAPTDGQANTALIALIAKVLGRPRSSVRIVSGETARVKTLEIAGLGTADLTSAFGPAPTA